MRSGVGGLHEGDGDFLISFLPTQTPLFVEHDHVRRVFEVVELVNLDGVLPAARRLPDGRRDGDAGQDLAVVLDLGAIV